MTSARRARGTLQRSGRPPLVPLAATAHGPVREAVVDEGRPTAGSVLRRFTLGSGPLKRTSDRFQFLARVLLVCSLATAVPVALVVASTTRAQALVEGAAQAQVRHQVDAELVEDPPLLTGVDDTSRRPARASAVWSGPLGEEHTGLVVVPPVPEAGSTVLVWVDRAGDLTTRPLDARGCHGAGRRPGDGDVPAGVGRSPSWLYLAVQAALDRSRLRRWAADWAAVEPMWRGSLS